MRTGFVAAACLVSSAQAHAGFWERDTKVGLAVGVDLVVNLDSAGDGNRVGAAVLAQYRHFWQDSPYWSDTPNQLAPVVIGEARLGWTHPTVFVEVTGSAGPLYPLEVGDGGFRPLFGAHAGAGLGMATDGSAGPVLAAGVLAPFTEVRFEVTHWQGWHAPRVGLGPRMTLNCCSYYL